MKESCGEILTTKHRFSDLSSSRSHRLFYRTYTINKFRLNAYYNFADIVSVTPWVKVTLFINVYQRIYMTKLNKTILAVTIFTSFTASASGGTKGDPSVSETIVDTVVTWLFGDTNNKK